MCMYIVENSVSQESIGVLSWNFQRLLKEEDNLTKRRYVHTTANTTITATFPITTTTSIVTTCRAKSIVMKILRNI